jgi:hypothetical protein
MVGAGFRVLEVPRLCLLEALVEAVANLLRLELAATAVVTGHDDPSGGDAGQAGHAEDLPELHDRRPFWWTRQC